MLDDKTLDFIEKIAKDASLGESQEKRKVVKSYKNHSGEGAGLGAILGAAAGAMSKKYKPLGMLAGAIGGSQAGKYIGKKTVTKSKQKYREGTVKRREQRDESDGAKVPRLGLNKQIESK